MDPAASERGVGTDVGHVQQTLVDTLQHGLTTIGHTLPTPDDPIYPLIEQLGLPKYPYDPRHAQELLSQSGWTKGADGQYRNAAGKPFTFEIRTVVTAPESGSICAQTAVTNRSGSSVAAWSISP